MKLKITKSKKSHLFLSIFFTINVLSWMQVIDIEYVHNSVPFWLRLFIVILLWGSFFLAIGFGVKWIRSIQTYVYDGKKVKNE